MSNNEILKPLEKIIFSPENSDNKASAPTVKQVQIMFEKRKQDLEDLRLLVSVNFNKKMVKKIKQEEQQFLEIFNLARHKKQVLQKYSFVLDPQYFEQKFLSN